MMIFSFPGIAFGEVEGKIDHCVTQKNIRIEPDALYSEALRLGLRVGDVVPAVEAIVKAENSDVSDQEIAPGRQPRRLAGPLIRVNDPKQRFPLPLSRLFALTRFHSVAEQRKASTVLGATAKPEGRTREVAPHLTIAADHLIQQGWRDRVR
jgi:hypothetical protein